VIIGPRRHVLKSRVIEHAMCMVAEAESEREINPVSTRGGWRSGRRRKKPGGA
jgi:hypothetical protein